MKEEAPRPGSLRRRYSRAVWTILVALAGLLVASTGLSPASASGGGWEYWQDLEYTEVTEDTCDVPGLTVRLDQISDGK